MTLVPVLENNKVLFSAVSPYDEIKSPILLMDNTWNHHIRNRHPEVTDTEHLKSAISNPAYVAQSKPGPNMEHSDNVVFVSDIVKLRSGRLHVFVESPKHEPKVTSALYSRKGHHASVLWVNDVQVSYDRDADVLYVSKQGAVASFTEQEDDGLLFRYKVEDEAPSGVTVIEFHAGWRGHEDALAERVSSFLNVPLSETRRALSSVYQ